MRRKLLVLVMCAFMLSAVAIGCGGSDDGTSETSASVTKAEFVKQANAACEKRNEEITEKVQAFSDETGDQEGKNPSQVEIKEFLEEAAVEVQKGQVEDLKELPVPAGDEDQVELIIERQEESLEKVEEEPFFRTSGNPYEELNKPVSDYGLTECSR